MNANTFIDNAKVMSKGQITIPKDVREILGVSCGGQSNLCRRKWQCKTY